MLKLVETVKLGVLLLKVDTLNRSYFKSFEHRLRCTGAVVGFQRPHYYESIIFCLTSYLYGEKSMFNIHHFV